MGILPNPQPNKRAIAATTKYLHSRRGKPQRVCFFCRFRRDLRRLRVRVGSVKTGPVLSPSDDSVCKYMTGVVRWSPTVGMTVVVGREGGSGVGATSAAITGVASRGRVTGGGLPMFASIDWTVCIHHSLQPNVRIVFHNECQVIGYQHLHQRMFFCQNPNLGWNLATKKIVRCCCNGSSIELRQ